MQDALEQVKGGLIHKSTSMDWQVLQSKDMHAR